MPRAKSSKTPIKEFFSIKKVLIALIMTVVLNLMSIFMMGFTLILDPFIFLVNILFYLTLIHLYRRWRSSRTN